MLNYQCLARLAKEAGTGTFFTFVRKLGTLTRPLMNPQASIPVHYSPASTSRQEKYKNKRKKKYGLVECRQGIPFASPARDTSRNEKKPTINADSEVQKGNVQAYK